MKKQNSVPQGLQEHCAVEALPMLFLLLLAEITNGKRIRTGISAKVNGYIVKSNWLLPKKWTYTRQMVLDQKTMASADGIRHMYWDRNTRWINQDGYALMSDIK